VDRLLADLKRAGKLKNPPPTLPLREEGESDREETEKHKEKAQEQGA
jgi:hypothetical protein